MTQGEETQKRGVQKAAEIFNTRGYSGPLEVVAVALEKYLGERVANST